MTIALKFDYLHVEFHTTGRPSLSAFVDKLLLLTHSGTRKKTSQILLLKLATDGH